MLIILLTLSPLCSAGELLTDPTRPANLQIVSKTVAETVEQQKSYVLSRIYINKKSKIATINNKKVKVGDLLGDNTEQLAEVIDITTDSVSLRINNEQLINVTIAPSVKTYNTK